MHTQDAGLNRKPVRSSHRKLVLKASGIAESDARQRPNHTSATAAHMRLRSELMGELGERIRRQGWTQAEAAALCGLTQPRINELVRGRIDRFSMDALVKIALALGLQLRVELAKA